jgi:hypothetical protein
MEDFETVTNDTGSVIHRDGNSLTSNHDSESMIEDDSNMTDRY